MPDDSPTQQPDHSAAPATPPELRCSQAGAALDNDPAGSSSAFTAFLLVTESGSWSRTAADDAVNAKLDPAAANWVQGNSDGLRPFAIRPVEGRRAAGGDSFLAGLVGDGDDLRGFDAPPAATDLAALARGELVGEPVAGPLVGVCTNGSRDRCCAIAGRPIAQQAVAELGGEQVVEISHLGGHRFAGTLVVLPWGYSYGFLDPDSALAVLQDVADGLVHPTHLRGRANLSPAAQAAEIAWRRELGAAPPAAVSVVDEWADGDVTAVTGNVDGRTETLRMRYRAGPTVTQTACGGKPFGTGVWLAG